MTFLTGLLADILEWLLTKLGALFASAYKQEQADSSAVAQGKADAQKLKDAKTDEDQVQAAQSVVDHTFH